MRIELSLCRLNKNGVMKMGTFGPGDPALMQGDGNVLIKNTIPCDEKVVCSLPINLPRNRAFMQGTTRSLATHFSWL